MQIGKFTVRPLDTLLVFFPISVVLEVLHAPALAIFVVSALAMLPLAGLMGRATEHLAERVGPGLGGLLNATFGNAAELIIALMALQRGMHDVVKASITGSILGNVLLVLGLSILAGGMKHPRQLFNRTASGLGATLLALSAVGLLVPAIFHAVVTPTRPGSEHALSLSIAVVLMGAYILSLVFQLVTHRQLFAGEAGDHEAEEPGAAHWSVGKSIGVLVGAAACVGLVSEFLVGAVEETALQIGLTHVFVGIIVLAIIGNAAEHSTAILVAMRNRMDLALNIAIGSSIQIALFVAPVLVFASYAFGQPLDLLFTPLEIVAVLATVFILHMVANDGESHWMEGVLLLAVYIILGIAFYFLPERVGEVAAGH